MTPEPQTLRSHADDDRITNAPGTPYPGRVTAGYMGLHKTLVMNQFSSEEFLSTVPGLSFAVHKFITPP